MEKGSGHLLMTRPCIQGCPGSNPDKRFGFLDHFSLSKAIP